MIAYCNGKYLEPDQISISPFDRGYQFGEGVYEVIRYYPGKFFELDAHIQRLKYSLEQIGICGADTNHLSEMLCSLIDTNKLTNELSIGYIQVTRGVQFPRRHLAKSNLEPTVLAYVEPFAQKTEAMTNGIHAGLEKDIRWLRCDIKSTLLLPNTLAKRHADSRGMEETIWHRDGKITEGTHTNVMFVKKNIVITPPLSNLILAGITRKVVLELCSKLNLIYEEKEITIEEALIADECFITGTTTEITPVIKIDDLQIGNGKMGVITKLLQNEFHKLYK